jgi:pilus assembly protein Flp/PilA
MRLLKNLSNQRGQGLIEYLIIVALVAVAGIAVMKVVGQNVHAQFANVAFAIQGKSSEVHLDEVRESQYQKRDMGDFFKGADNRSNKKDSDE